MSEQGEEPSARWLLNRVRQGRDRGVNVHKHLVPVLLTLEVTLTRSQRVRHKLCGAGNISNDDFLTLVATRCKGILGRWLVLL